MGPIPWVGEGGWQGLVHIIYVTTSSFAFLEICVLFYIIYTCYAHQLPAPPLPPLPLPCEEPEQVPARRSLFDEPPEVEAREVEEEKVTGDAVGH